jgi:uncharacterized membrane protein YcaP (DUF421 family)
VTCSKSASTPGPHPASSAARRPARSPSQGVVQEDYSLTAAVQAVSTFSVAGFALAWVDYRFPRSRPVLAGTPRIVVRDGEPILDVLSSERTGPNQDR